jgi:NitT/TauT family transport system substrate-binding protein
MIKGEVDISKATEFVLVQKAFEKANISAITTYYESLGAVIVGRKDLRIENVSDLLGKRIGVARGAIPEFYLGRFLNLNGINIKNVTIVDMKPPLMINDLFAGNIDAICLADSYLYQLEHQQMDRLVVWPAQSGQLTYGGLVANNNWMVLHPELIKRFLKALLQAEDYAIRNPTAAKTLTQKRLGYDDAYMAVVWPDSQFSLSFDQSFITAMEDEARWMIANNLTAEK